MVCHGGIMKKMKRFLCFCVLKFQRFKFPKIQYNNYTYSLLSYVPSIKKL